jgi:hypothetical protein
MKWDFLPNEPITDPFNDADSVETMDQRRWEDDGIASFFLAFKIAGSYSCRHPNNDDYGRTLVRRISLA